MIRPGWFSCFSTSWPVGCCRQASPAPSCPFTYTLGIHFGRYLYLGQEHPSSVSSRTLSQVPLSVFVTFTSINPDIHPCTCSSQTQTLAVLTPVYYPRLREGRQLQEYQSPPSHFSQCTAHLLLITIPRFKALVLNNSLPVHTQTCFAR